MEIDIHTNKRVLYKTDNSSQWRIGVVCGDAYITEKGLFIEVMAIDDWKECENPTFDHDEGFGWEPGSLEVNINNLFLDAVELDNWMKDRLMTKEEYIEFIKSEDFDKHAENAWFSDGEYYYYPVSKYNEIWINKQPFDYVIRGE